MQEFRHKYLCGRQWGRGGVVVFSLSESHDPYRSLFPTTQSSSVLSHPHPRLAHKETWVHLRPWQPSLCSCSWTAEELQDSALSRQGSWMPWQVLWTCGWSLEALSFCHCLRLLLPPDVPFPAWLRVLTGPWGTPSVSSQCVLH